MGLESTGDDAGVKTLGCLVTHDLVVISKNLLINGRIHRRRDRNQLSRAVSFVDLRRSCQLVHKTVGVLKVAPAISLALELGLYILLSLGLHLVVFALRIELLQLNLEIRPTLK